MSRSTINERCLADLPWHQLQLLLDTCYPRPPRDVFQRVVASSHRSQRVWLASDGSSLLGVVMLSPHTKGGHLDNLAVLPNARGNGLAYQLVTSLLEAVRNEGASMVTLTTRIPSFFKKFGFQDCGQLSDGSVAMMILLSDTLTSEVVAS